MAGPTLCAARIILLLLSNFVLVFSGPTNKLVKSVPFPLVLSALNSLNEDSPTHHTYKDGNLISAQKLDESPYVVYRLTFDLNPTCREALDPCPREACTVDVKQHEQGDISVLKESIQCMYLYPQSLQDDPVQIQESNYEQELNENLYRQIMSNQSVELDHEIQKAGDNNDRPFIAVRASNPSYCPGCPYELNPNLPGLLAFGEQVARSMDELIQNDYKHKLINIIKVTRAVPPSSNVVQYQILLRMGQSDCLKNAIDQSECSVQEDLPVKVCLVTFEEQPWQQSSRRITKNNCTMGSDMEIERNISTSSALTSEALVKPEPKKEGIDSGKVEALENLTGMLDYNYATSEKTENQEHTEVTEHAFVKISINRSQDDTRVEGFEDKAKEFNEFLRDFNLPTREAKSNVDTGKEEVKEDIILPKRVSSANAVDDESRVSRRNTRETNLVGAPVKVEIDDEIKTYANKGLRKLLENSESTNELIVAEIVEASRQVVSGMLYKIKVKVGTSNCTRGVRNNCQLQEGGELKDCLFTIWSQPWIDHDNPKITISCDLKNQRKRSLRGTQYSRKMLKLAEELKVERMFDEFIENYNKTYSSVEEKHNRLKIFRKNLEHINELRKYEQGTAVYGATIFADLSPKEFKEQYLGLRADLKRENGIPLKEAEIPDDPAPVAFDWRNQGVVTPVKNQGQCGSCWAFSVTGNIEGQYAIRHGNLLSLSEQELVDCDTADGGCNGGYMTTAYEAVEKLGGLELESDYPYDARNEKCHFVKDKARVQVVSALNITTDENKMAQWLVANGPISVGLNANAMQFYLGGVSHPFSFLCNPNNIDHGVLIVGYGTSKYPLFEKELPYWIIKNSWGERWGEQGYYRLYRGDGTCGVNTMATSAVVA